MASSSGDSEIGGSLRWRVQIARRGIVLADDIDEQALEIEQVRLGMVRHFALAQVLGAADELGERADAEPRQDVADFLGHGVEEVHHHLGRALELAAQLFVLRGDADRAGIQVALAHVDAAERDERGGAEVELLRAEDRRLDDIVAGAHAAVGAEDDAAAQVIEQQDLLRFGDAEFPRRAGVLDRGERRSARAAIVPGDEDDIGVRLRHAGGDGADARLGDELHA